METKIKNLILFCKAISLMVLFGACAGHGADGSSYSESIEKYSFKLWDPSARFLSVSYPELGVVDTLKGNKAEWELDLYTPKVQVIMLTNNGVDTLIYEIKKTKINQEEDYFGEDVLVIRIDRPTILYHTFDSVYFNETPYGSSGNNKYTDVELILKQ